MTGTVSNARTGGSELRQHEPDDQANSDKVRDLSVKDLFADRKIAQEDDPHEQPAAVSSVVETQRLEVQVDARSNEPVAVVKRKVSA